jgi:hypothetical protein
MNVQRMSNKGWTEVKQMLDEKAGWQNSTQDSRTQDGKIQQGVERMTGAGRQDA